MSLGVLYATEAVLFAGLAWIASSFSLVPVLALTVADGLIAITARSLGRAATVSVTSSAGLLREGNALANTMYCTSFLAGPAVGGVVIAAGSVSTALLVCAGAFAAVSVALSTATGLPGAAPHGEEKRRRLRAAFAYANEHRMVRALFALQAVAIAFFTISMPVEVVYAQRSLHAGAAGYGVLMSSWGAGAVAGSTMFMRWRTLSIRLLITAGAALLGLGFLILTIAPVLAIAVIGTGLAGVGNGIYMVSARTAMQEIVEESWMALMMSFNESMSMLVPGLGIVIGGTVTALSSPRAAWATAACGSLIVAAATWIVLRPATRRVVKSSEPAPRESARPRGSPTSAAPPV
jgi:ENTS family enterobactin (siderophore) exporter